MAVNPYFHNYSLSNEQGLIEDLIIESIKIYGIDCLYLPRTIVNEDFLFGEDPLSTFDKAYSLEMYIKSMDGFTGDGTLMSKFGLEIRDELVLTIAQKRFGQEITKNNTTEKIDRPSEGDLIYFPLNKKIFEVKFVEHEAIFYQLHKLQTYDLHCELFGYSHQRFNTGNTAIDSIETKFSGDSLSNKILLESGHDLTSEDGRLFVQESYSIEKTDKQANNTFFDSTKPDIVNWDDSNPFSVLRW
jgi:hypothetical protein